MKNNYSFSENLKNVKALIFTKLFYRKARLIRLPFYIRGAQYFSYGQGFTTGYSCRIEMFNLNNSKEALIEIGNNVKIGDHVHIAAGEKVILGDNCLLASKIYISDISHGNYSPHSNDSSPDVPPDIRPLSTKPVYIGNNVWIGENVCILPGVTIGEGSIIGANSVVTKNINKNTIVAGIPATPIKIYNVNKNIWENVRRE